MKHTYIILGCFWIMSNLLAKSPENMNYQAVIRNTSNELVSNQKVGMQISILQGAADGTVVYSETHTPTTNANGLVSIDIGAGSTNDDFSSIDWANGPYFLKTETDPGGGENYSITGVSQLLSVPYALYAKQAGATSITGDENTFDLWDKNWHDDVMLKFDQSIYGHKIFKDSLFAAGLGLPYTFGPDYNYVGEKGAYIGFGHGGVSEDFIGYKNNTFYFMDSPGGADVTDPDLIVGGNVGFGIKAPIEKLEVDGNIDMHEHTIKNVANPVDAQDAATKAYIDKIENRITEVEDMLVNAGLYTLTDVDGNSYNVVKIGTQIWMAENLKTTKYNDGTDIRLATNASWDSLNTPCYCYFNNDKIIFGNSYGPLYNWFAVEKGNLCPSNWHVPTELEWKTLIGYLGGQGIAGGKMKETGTEHWYPPNTDASNESGFTAFAGGFRYPYFSNPKAEGYWWSGTEETINDAWYTAIGYNNSRVIKYFFSKSNGLSVRCIKD